MKRLSGSPATRDEVCSRRQAKVACLRARIARYIVCAGGTLFRFGVSSLLERALVAQFRSRYFEVPLCNTQLKNKRSNKHLDGRFKPRALGKILSIFEHPAKAL